MDDNKNEQPLSSNGSEENKPKKSDLDFNTWDLSDYDAESEYSPFNEELDELLPVETLFSKENQQVIINGKIPFLQWVSILRNSPAKNAEAETFMGTIITLAVQAGQWIDAPQPKNQQLEKMVLPEDVTIDLSGITLDYKQGIEELEKIDFVRNVIDDDGRTWIKPQDKMILYFKEKLKRYGPEST